jgi:hypothetical protein
MCEMYFNLGICENCNIENARDCPIYVCRTQQGFVVLCCIVCAIANGYSIIERFDDESRLEDSDLPEG